jgi:hypothetical protein
MGSESANTFFDDTWIAHAHNPQDPDWRHQSYRLLGPPVSCIDDFWVWWNSVKGCVTRTMSFMMREGVHPSWDDPANIDGCIASAMVPEHMACDTFKRVVQCALGETLAVANCDINGVSMGPKRGICVIKVWMRTLQTDASCLNFPKGIDAGSVRVQPCRQHLDSART